MIVIWATDCHRPNLSIFNIAPSHQNLKNVLSFFGFWCISKCYHRFFEECIIVFQAPTQFQKNMSRKLLSINLKFGCSSYTTTSTYGDICNVQRACHAASLLWCDPLTNPPEQPSENFNFHAKGPGVFSKILMGKTW
jgi:hypothetical protein